MIARVVNRCTLRITLTVVVFALLAASTALTANNNNKNQSLASYWNFDGAIATAAEAISPTIATSTTTTTAAVPPALAGLYSWAINPRDAGMGIVGVSSMMADASSSSLASSDCDFKLTAADPSMAGQSVTFRVPQGVVDIVNAGETNKPANYHIAFEGDDGLYYEVGMYYGDWSRDSGIGYNASKFQIAWGVGGILRGVSHIPVVANHRLELSILYDESNTKQWQVKIKDLDSGNDPESSSSATTAVQQIVNIGHPSMRVKSDYLTFVEAGSFAPNTNIQRLGLVEVLKIQQATMTADDGGAGAGSGGSSNGRNKVELSIWPNGYLVTNCSPANGSYGVTYTGVAGNFKIGYRGETTNNGYRFW